MRTMDETEFVAHAVCDYLRPHISETELRFISRPLQCGEAEASIIEALGVAIQFAVPLPDFLGEKILSLPGLSEENVSLIRWQLSQLPQFFSLAS